MTPELRQITALDGQPVQVIRLGPVDVHVTGAGGKYPDGNYAVVRGGDTTASFDMPMGCHTLPPDALGRDMVVLSHVHEDHTAGLGLLPDAPVHVHGGDVEALRSRAGLAVHYGYSPTVNAALCERAAAEFHYRPRPDAQAYADGAIWSLGGGIHVQALHAPGHTSGHCILMVEPQGIAFIGDIDLTGFGPYYGDATSDLAAFRCSLRLVKELDAACWITSHHRGVITDRAVFLQRLAQFGAVLDRRDEALLDFLRDGGPATLEGLARHRFVYPAHFEDLFVDDAERRMIGQHLAALEAAGQVRQEAGHWRAL
ncbi:MBL fold metallo-hydrolase [Pseudacidovorax sp. NFM-22]|uniref:MBL fold metallo-hydrolase n=1 Tax=Pseudacidovorax sp. NFM-22 TaxID=2744469 RepID=UPI001F1E4494|nr:MBL fold metallo-hydrolase [Pseudacidovorax sp. NFM-22]